MGLSLQLPPSRTLQGLRIQGEETRHCRALSTSGLFVLLVLVIAHVMVWGRACWLSRWIEPQEKSIVVVFGFLLFTRLNGDIYS